eukprot:9483_1
MDNSNKQGSTLNVTSDELAWGARCKKYARKFATDKKNQISIIMIWDKIRALFSTEERHKYFRLLLDNFASDDSNRDNSHAADCLKSIVGEDIVDDYVDDADSCGPIQNNKVVGMPPIDLFEAFPRWFARAALFLCENALNMCFALERIT